MEEVEEEGRLGKEEMELRLVRPYSLIFSPQNVLKKIKFVGEIIVFIFINYPYFLSIFKICYNKYELFLHFYNQITVFQIICTFWI